MTSRSWVTGLLLLASGGVAHSQTRTGTAAFGDWSTDAPGVVRKITADDLVPPYATKPAGAPSGEVDRPAGAQLHTLPGFTVTPYAKLDGPRILRAAPNGDIFVAETASGRILILRAKDGADKPDVTETFAEGLDRPFGIAFYPAGPHPKWVYVANANSVVRFAYTSGDLKAQTAKPEVVVPKLSLDTRMHFTRDVAFSPEGKRMYVSVGSGTNAGEGWAKKTPEEVAALQAGKATGAPWGVDENRADVLVFDPEGHDQKTFATGIRNCVGLAVQPRTRDVWCATNERDLLGDNLPPDYVTRVKEGGYYGWPWYYIGAHEDPRLKGVRPDLVDKVTVPDVLIQPHSAPLEITFYTARSGPAAFPAEYQGDAFVALHGSWNREQRTGYKVARVKLNNGVPTGEYEDFLTGFVVDGKSVWGRPVGVAVAHDGALLVSDDGGDMVWRVAYSGAAH
ncbi:MAG TPA: PQQ-dependent sugar dehydrogenase [Caulobacteraceae bacterium]|jgi:hypothetical protein